MAPHRNRLILTFVIYGLCSFCLLNGAEVSPSSATDFSRILPLEKTELIEALNKHLRKVATDFKERGLLYEAWQKDKDSKALKFFFDGSEYGLHETMNLFLDTLNCVDSPIFTSNSFDCIYVDKNIPFIRGDIYYKLFYTLSDCEDIYLTVEDMDEFIFVVTSHSAMADKISIYDTMSYLKHMASKNDLVIGLEKVKQKKLSLENYQAIINLLDKTSADYDVAFNSYLFSERAILANVASSTLVKDRTEFEEAKKTICYIDSLIAKKGQSQDTIYDENGDKSVRAKKQEIELSEIDPDHVVLYTFISRRVSDIPDFLEIYKRNQLRADKLLSAFIQLCQEKFPEEEDAVNSNH